MEKIFIALLFFSSLYSYIVYPFALYIICLWKSACEGKGKSKGGRGIFEEQSVTIIVAAYNEVKGIENKINNLILLRREIPGIEIIVASDCSSDGTDEICEKYANNNELKFIRSPIRGGKEVAQYNALCLAQGKIIVFSDVSTLIYKECLSNILNYFASSAVGAVSSQDARLNRHGAKDSEGLYLKYELWVRRMESQLAGCVGMSGSFFAVRKEFCLPWNTHICSDFNLALNTIRAGSLVISASDVFGYYPSLKNVDDEHARRVRTVIRGMAGLYTNRDILIPFKNPLFAFQIFSHKLMRWISPWCFIALFIILIFFWSENYFNTIVFYGQLLLLLTYVLSRVFNSLRQNIIFKLPVFFMESNLAMIEAGVKFLTGERMKIWNPSQR